VGSAGGALSDVPPQPAIASTSTKHPNGDVNLLIGCLSYMEVHQVDDRGLTQSQ
jgi:hypothetical protein